MVINGHQPLFKTDIRFTLSLPITAEGRILPFQNRAVVLIGILVYLWFHKSPGQRKHPIEHRHNSALPILKHCHKQPSLVGIRQHLYRLKDIEIKHNSRSRHAVTLLYFSQAVISMPLGTALATLLIKCISWLTASERCSRWISLHWLRSRPRR